MHYPTLQLCLIDMNNGHANQAMRCFRLLLDDFASHVTRANPHLEVRLEIIEPRNRQELPPRADLYLSTGGPGSPYEHDGESWLGDMHRFYDKLVNDAIRLGPAAPSLFGVCYTFELLVRYFKVSAMTSRHERKFGVMPVYMTDEGQRHPLTHHFGDRLFAFEHRNWEAVDVDRAQLARLGGAVLARESRDGTSKGRAVLAFDFAPGVEGTQFHPEADRLGVVNWLSKREQAESFVQAYGYTTYERMIKTLDNPQRLARTFSLLIPGWLTRKFNALALTRDWHPIQAPQLNMEWFAGDTPSAASIQFASLAPPPMERPEEDEAFAFPSIPEISEPTFEDMLALDSKPHLLAAKHPPHGAVEKSS